MEKRANICVEAVHDFVKDINTMGKAGDDEANAYFYIGLEYSINTTPSIS